MPLGLQLFFLGFRPAPEIFRTMNGIRSSEQTIANGGTGYRFNTDGNQVTYRLSLIHI